MDNFSVDITSDKKVHLELAFRMAWSNVPSHIATHFRIVNIKKHTRCYGSGDNLTHFSDFEEDPDGLPTLIFFWREEVGSMQLDQPLNHIQSTIHALKWLSKANYPKEPDHDGTNKRGWRVFNGNWGGVMRSSCSIIAIQPEWLMYGK